MDGDIADLAAFVGSIAGAKKASGQPFTHADFCNWEPPPLQEATVEEAFAMFKGLARKKNG